MLWHALPWPAQLLLVRESYQQRQSMEPKLLRSRPAHLCPPLSSQKSEPDDSSKERRDITGTEIHLPHMLAHTMLQNKTTAHATSVTILSLKSENHDCEAQLSASASWRAWGLRELQCRRNFAGIYSMYQQTNSLTQASSEALLTDAAVPTAATLTHTLRSYLALLSYHGDSCSSDSGADWRPWDNAAQRCAHVYGYNKAFTHRLHVLRTELQQHKRLGVYWCYWLPPSLIICEKRGGGTYCKTLVKGRVHCFEDAAVWFPLRLTLIALASFVVFSRQE